MISIDPPHIHVRNEISALEGEREGRGEGREERGEKGGGERQEGGEKGRGRREGAS